MHTLQITNDPWNHKTPWEGKHFKMDKITIHLPNAIVNEVKRGAATAGLSVSKYAGRLLKASLGTEFETMDDLLLKAATLTRRSPQKISAILERHSNPALIISEIFSNTTNFRLIFIGNTVKVAFINQQLFSKKLAAGERAQKALAIARTTIDIPLNGANKYQTVANFLTELFNAYVPTITDDKTGQVSDANLEKGLQSLLSEGLISPEDFKEALK